MKTVRVVALPFAALSVALAANAGGTLNFSNFVPASGIDAPVYQVDGTTRLDGTISTSGRRYWAQLYAGVTADALQPLGVPVSFFTGAASGYVNTHGDSVVEVPTVEPGALAYVQLRAWESLAGYSYEQVDNVGSTGKSPVFTVVTGGAGTPPSVPANLVGLQSFHLVAPDIPGTVNFSNLVPEAGINAPVFDVDGVTRLPGGAGYLAQLFAGVSEDALSPVGTAVPFEAGDGAGYWDASSSAAVALPGISPGQTVFTQVRVWRASTGLDYDGAVAAGLPTGMSAVLRLTAGGSGSYFGPPANLAGLTSFQVIGPDTKRGGLVNFSNKVPPAGVDAPVFNANGITPLSGTGYFAQLYAGANSNALVAVGLPAPFKVGEDVGYWDAGSNVVVELPGVQPGRKVFVEVRAWDGHGGTSYEDALAAAVCVGGSGVFEITAGGAAVPYFPPAALIGLASFHLTSPVVPPGRAGTVFFRNLSPGTGIDAPVFDVDGTTRLAGDAYQAQLYAGPYADELLPLGSPVTFHTGAAAGYWKPGDGLAIAIPNVLAGTSAIVEARAWMAASGATFEEAEANHGYRGTSGTITVVTGGAGDPPSLPADLKGLKSFALHGPPVFRRQPQGATVFAGQSFALEPEVVSSDPVTYQWQRDGVDLPGATSLRLDLGPVAADVAGVYRLAASNSYGTTLSSPALVTVFDTRGGASVLFLNRVPEAGLDAPVFDTDGLTRLSGTQFAAQLYAGTTAETLQPVGDPSPFGEGNEAGYLPPTPPFWRILPGLTPGDRAFVEVRAWESGLGTNYEETLIAGGKVGRSPVFEVTTGGGIQPPAPLTGLNSFTLGYAPRIVSQPKQVRWQVGQEAALSVQATGSPELNYTWYFRGQPLAEAPSESTLKLPNANPAQAGDYQVVVSNSLAAVTSDTIQVEITEATSGGTFNFNNREGVFAPVYDLGRATKVTGEEFVAQLLVGPTPTALAPAGQPQPFSTNLVRAGFWTPATVVATNVAPGVPAFCQVEVWDSSAGASFDAARAAGGKTGRSSMFRVVTGGFGDPPSAPATLTGLYWFELQQSPVLVWATPDVIIRFGEPFFLEALLTGTQPIQYRWQIFAGGDVWQTVNGGFANRLYLGPASSKTEGLYRLVATNTVGQLTTMPIHVFVAAGVQVGTPGWQHIRLHLADAQPQPLRIEASTNLVSWKSRYTVTNESEWLEFSDPAATNLTTCFYRARSLQTGRIVSQAAAGFTELVIPYGFSMRANPLLTRSNTVAGILTGLPEGTTIYKYGADQTFTINTFVLGAWTRPDDSLAPGEGVIIRSGMIDTYHVVVSGEVPEGNLAVPIRTGWSLLAYPGPLTGRLDSDLHLPVKRDDNVDFMSPVDYSYLAFVYGGTGAWFSGDPPEPDQAPIPDPGEAFWFYTDTDRSWDLEFSTGD